MSDMVPHTRVEMFLAKAAGQDVKTPVPETREEMYLNEIANQHGGGGGGASVAQSDWNANEGEPGHILNRPFYSEHKTVTLLDTITLTANGSFGGLEGVGLLPELLDISDGMECNVVYNGVEYVCTARATTFQDIPCAILGNSYAFGDENTGEPFLLCAFSEIIASQVGIYGGVIPLDGSGTFSISIIHHKEDITFIHEKYLPMKLLDVGATMIDVNKVTVDMTYAEIATAAYRGDTVIRMKLKLNSEYYFWLIPLCIVTPEFLQFNLYLANDSSGGTQVVQVNISSDNTVTFSIASFHP